MSHISIIRCSTSKTILYVHIASNIRFMHMMYTYDFVCDIELERSDIFPEAAAGAAGRTGQAPAVPTAPASWPWQSGSARIMPYMISALTVWVSQTSVSEWVLEGRLIATDVYPSGVVLWIWNMTVPTSGPSTWMLVRLQTYALTT